MQAHQKQALTKSIEQGLTRYSNSTRILTGLRSPIETNILARQLVDTVRRVEYAHKIASRQWSIAVTTPYSGCFDPLKAATHHRNNGALDEACWCIFLSTHCGRHVKDGWLLSEQIYGGLSSQPVWTWSNISNSVQNFENWFRGNVNQISGKFGNHRKFESFNKLNTIETIETYITWVQNAGSHSALLANATQQPRVTPQSAFSELYSNMSHVSRFGRIGKFDYLTMLAKLGLANLEPGKAYLSGSTGPIKGTRLLITGSETGSLTAAEGEQVISQLKNFLPITSMYMQVMEDGICNWQKYPRHYVHFGG